MCLGGQRLQHHISGGQQPHRLWEPLQRVLQFKSAWRSLSDSPTVESKGTTESHKYQSVHFFYLFFYSAPNLILQVFYPHLWSSTDAPRTSSSGKLLKWHLHCICIIYCNEFVACVKFPAFMWFKALCLGHRFDHSWVSFNTKENSDGWQHPCEEDNFHTCNFERHFPSFQFDLILMYLVKSMLLRGIKQFYHG